MKFRKAQALLQYAIIITIVALALATMHTYLRRSIQAKVKDLTDQIICDRQLASLNDFVIEKSTRDIESTYSLQKNEGAGGISSLSTVSAFTTQVEHTVENLEKADYGREVSDIINPPATYMDGSSGSGDAGDLSGNISGSDAGTSGRDSGGGRMFYYNQGD